MPLNISTEKLTDGEAIALGAIEIVSIPHISIIDGRENAITEIVEKYRDEMSSMLGEVSQAAHFYDNEILGYQAQSYRGKSSKKEWWYVAASKNCPDTGRRGPSTISLKNLC